MVDRARPACRDGHIAVVLLMDIKAAFPSVAKGRLVNLMKVRQMDGDHIRWMESVLSQRTVEMIIEDNAMGRHQVEAVVLQGSPVSPILFAIITSGLIEWVEEYVSEAEGLSFVDYLSWVATGNDVNHIVLILERCAANSIEWASRRVLQFDTAKMEEALFMRRRGQRKHLPAITDSKDQSRQHGHTIQYKGDTLVGHLDGHTSNVQAAAQPMQEERQGSRSETMNPDHNIQQCS